MVYNHRETDGGLVVLRIPPKCIDTAAFRLRVRPQDIWSSPWSSIPLNYRAPPYILRRLPKNHPRSPLPQPPWLNPPNHAPKSPPSSHPSILRAPTPKSSTPRNANTLHIKCGFWRAQGQAASRRQRRRRRGRRPRGRPAQEARERRLSAEDAGQPHAVRRMRTGRLVLLGVDGRRS